MIRVGKVYWVELEGGIEQTERVFLLELEGCNGQRWKGMLVRATVMCWSELEG